MLLEFIVNIYLLKQLSSKTDIVSQSIIIIMRIAMQHQYGVALFLRRNW